MPGRSRVDRTDGSTLSAAGPTRGDLAAAIRRAYTGRFTQTELAERLGVAQNTVSRWATGDVEPRLDDIVALEAMCELPRGTILRSAGYVQDELSPEDAVRADQRLDAPRREMLLAAYEAALNQSHPRRAR